MVSKMPKIKVGCCGFPEKKQKYFKDFDLVEIQSTFYQPPVKIETVQKWRKEAPKNFEYALKAWQLITHPPSSPTYRRLKQKIPAKKKKNYGFFRQTPEVFEAWQKTKEIAQILGAKIIVFQCPASFLPKKENLENFKKFFKKIKKSDFIFCWEPRGDWPEKLIKDLCQELDLIHCVDPFKQRSVYGKINYFRLHGKTGYSYQYTKKDLIELLKFCNRSQNYVLFNNLSMFKDAKNFKSLIYG